MKKILLSVISFIGAVIGAYFLEVIGLITINIFDSGFLDRYNSSDTLKTQGGLIVYLLTFIIFLIALLFIWKPKTYWKKNKF